MHLEHNPTMSNTSLLVFLAHSSPFVGFVEPMLALAEASVDLEQLVGNSRVTPSESAAYVACEATQKAPQNSAKTHCHNYRRTKPRILPID